MATACSDGALGPTTSTGSGGDTSVPTNEGSGGTGSVPATANPTYVKASNPGVGDRFGVAIALSADGNVMAVGANGESSSATGVEGVQIDDSAGNAGAVYVFERNGHSWQQRVYLKASNSGSGDGFGTAVALSADGLTLVVGAPYEQSAATSIDGDSSDDTTLGAGAVYVFSNDGSSWKQQAYVKGSYTDRYDQFGVALALAADGSRLVVGADGDDGAATGIDGDPSDKSAREAGAVYVFDRDDGTWQQTSYIKASNTDPTDHFGAAVSLSADGATLAVGAYSENSAAMGVDGDETNNAAEHSGAAYVFVHDGSTWHQEAYVKPSRDAGEDAFGSAVSLAADGNVLAVGAPGDDSRATGVDGDPNDYSMPFSGAAYVFSRTSTQWQQAAYLKASNTGEADEFGFHLSLSPDASTLVVGAALESSSTTGIDAAPNDSAPSSGAAYVFLSDGGAWQSHAFVKAPNTNVGDRFGWSIAMSNDAALLAIGASREASSASGIGGDATDDAAAQSGAVYVYSGVRDLPR